MVNAMKDQGVFLQTISGDKFHPLVTSNLKNCIATLQSVYQNYKLLQMNEAQKLTGRLMTYGLEGDDLIPTIIFLENDIITQKFYGELNEAKENKQSSSVYA